MEVAGVDDPLAVGDQEGQKHSEARVIFVQPTHTARTVRRAGKHTLSRIGREGRADDTQRISEQGQE